MNAKVKRWWLKALRSGKYNQGRCFLRLNGDYCCLGVLCDVYQKQTGKGEWRDRVFFDGAGDDSSGYLPRAVQEWAGLSVSNPLLGRMLTAAELNDSGKSFEFIAGRIEKCLSAYKGAPR